jgi:hypothetical protein
VWRGSAISGGRVKGVRLTSRDLHDRCVTSLGHLPAPSRPMRHIASSPPRTFTTDASHRFVTSQDLQPSMQHIARLGPVTPKNEARHQGFRSEDLKLDTLASLFWVQVHPTAMQDIVWLGPGTPSFDASHRCAMWRELRGRCGVAFRDVRGAAEAMWCCGGGGPGRWRDGKSIAPTWVRRGDGWRGLEARVDARNSHSFRAVDEGTRPLQSSHC